MMDLETIRKPTISQSGTTSLPLSHTVGNTPLFKLRSLTASLPPSVHLYVKAEWFNPSGSVKDRPARAILRVALNADQFANGRILLDSTSGNMGIAYATLGNHYRVGTHLAIPSNASPERLKILQALGTSLTLTDPTEGSDGARNIARDMAARYPEHYYFADQYNNPANWQAHYDTTGPEIVRQTMGSVTHFVAGLGTSGTLIGTGRYLKSLGSEIKVLGVQPESPLHGLEGLKHYPTSLVPGIYDPGFPDQILSVQTEKAYEMTRRLALEEGLFCGVSSGAAVHAALEVGQVLDHGTLVVLLPDSGLKYLSESFWESKP